MDTKAVVSLGLAASPLAGNVSDLSTASSDGGLKMYKCHRRLLPSRSGATRDHTAFEDRSTPGMDSVNHLRYPQAGQHTNPSWLTSVPAVLVVLSACVTVLKLKGILQVT